MLYIIRYLYPRAGEAPQSILPSAWGWLWFDFLCRLWLFGRSASAVVSFALVFGSRSVLGWVGPRGGGFVGLNVGSRLVLVAVLRIGFGRSANVVVSYRFFLCLVPRVGRHRPKLGNFLCKLAVFK